MQFMWPLSSTPSYLLWLSITDAMYWKKNDSNRINIVLRLIYLGHWISNSNVIILKVLGRSRNMITTLSYLLHKLQKAHCVHESHSRISISKPCSLCILFGLHTWTLYSHTILRISKYMHYSKISQISNIVSKETLHLFLLIQTTHTIPIWGQYSRLLPFISPDFYLKLPSISDIVLLSWSHDKTVLSHLGHTNSQCELFPWEVMKASFEVEITFLLNFLFICTFPAREWMELEVRWCVLLWVTMFLSAGMLMSASIYQTYNYISYIITYVISYKFDEVGIFEYLLGVFRVKLNVYFNLQLM